MPGKLNGILRLHFCVWTDAETAWMTRELAGAVHRRLRRCDEHHGKAVCAWLDLSQNRDITALARRVQTGEVEIIEGQRPARPSGQTDVRRLD
jgi:phage terminase large subunit-like protein